MASSQVEIVSSASFGCILHDQNRGDRFTNTFQRNLKDYLLQTCIPNSSPDENSLNSGSWVRNPNNNENNSINEAVSPNSKRNARVLDRWAKARNMVAPIDSPNSPTQLDTSAKITNPGGVSSLVQKWRGFTETPPIQNPKGNNNSHNAAAFSPVSTPRSNSENIPPPNDIEHEGNNPNPLSALVQSNRPKVFDELPNERFDTPAMTEDSFTDWESERTGSPSVQGGRDSADGGEKERLRVADVIRKLTSENQMQGCLVSWKSEQGTSVSSPSASPHLCEPSLPELRTAVSDQAGEQRGCFLSSPVVSSPRLRGRQAFNDLLMQLERDRHRELDGLVERKAVSKFSHRGRIQSLLRLRFLRREAEVRNDNHMQSLRRKAPIGAQQQHSHAGLLEEAQRHSHCEVAVEAPRHSHGMEVRPPEISCPGGDANDEVNLCHERFGAQQRFGGLKEATVGPCQHSKTAQGEGAVEVRQQSPWTVLEESRARQPSAVVLLREKFNVRVENDASNPKSPRGVVVNSNAEVKNSSSSNQVMGEPPQPHDQNLESCSMEDIHKEATPSSDTLQKGTSDEVCNIDSKEYDAAPLTASNGWEEDVSAEEQESSNPEQTTTNEDMINCDWPEQESDDQQLVGIDHDWISDASRPWSEWDEQEANVEQNIETNNDWIMDISRPRSDWEVLREVRYKEMLDPYLDNGDIRQLLERRSVSTFLSSNLREAMDQLMISRAERIPQSTGNEQEEEDGFRNRLEQLMLSRTQRQANPGSNHQEDGGQDIEEHQEEEDQEDQEDEEEQDNDDDHENDEEQEEEDDDEDSPITSRYSEVGDNVDQVADGVRTWSHDGDHEVSDDSDEVASHSSQQSQSSHASYQGTQFCSFTNHSSIEMELIYDLRRHMVELQHEMSKLRKSLKSCVNMQSKLQRSIKHEVEDAVSLSGPPQNPPKLYKLSLGVLVGGLHMLDAANNYRKSMENVALAEAIIESHEYISSLYHIPSVYDSGTHLCWSYLQAMHGKSVRRVGKESLNGVPRKRSCCVCYEMQVDSLLYRCGHMCTCFKCAHELQWSSGKCPICRAPIVDVVRAYANDS